MREKTIKVWLDDEPTVPWRAALHPSPEWTHSRWPEETIELLKTGTVRELSLDHDLGDSEAAITEGRKERTGYDVVLWIEDQVKNGDFDPPVIRSHSQNGPGRARIDAAVKQIAVYESER